jgi:VCBS repeat-containing protein
VPSATTQTHTTTVPANGQGTIPATHATGTLLILNNSQSPVTFSAGTIFPNTDGVGPMVSIAIDATITIDYGSPVVVAAHVVQAGSGGNFDATSNNFVSTDSSGCPSSPCDQAFNNSAFSGGQDAQSYTTVTQSDIDNAANALESQNTPDPMQVLQGQVQPNEQWAGSPQCTPKVTSNHKAGDRATQVTVNVTFTCTGEVYDHDGAETLATKLLMQQGATDPGSGYAPVGQIKTIVTNATVGNQNTVALTVSAEGIWVYQFSTDQEQVLAGMIAGKNKREAQQILSNQTGVAQVTIQLSGRGGQVLPSNPAKISFVVQTVPGA